eukprot:2392083-Amphidinium_carterae.1
MDTAGLSGQPMHPAGKTFSYRVDSKDFRYVLRLTALALRLTRPRCTLCRPGKQLVRSRAGQREAYSAPQTIRKE